ncbi:hypothetical protein CDL12_30539 [Handroanthus impetiginosus]|uniref:3'-5' exonuclease domain-containing protein n=1 Tax=Handroanthus impetiginosus TaxID=429701 RepID=A0A2G9FV65_9LAMI|nr:hypothetical protein CDL12_30539 [Handroanthus impetiginosus]
MAPNFRIKPVCHKYVVSFFKDKIHTTVTSDCATVERWIKEIERPNLFIVGFDIQYSPWVRLNDFVSTVQLCVGGRCLIYQLEFIDYDFPDVLLDFLANEEYTFVGLDISHALARLKREHALDISRAMVVDYAYYDAGLRELTELVLDKDLVNMPDNVMLRKWSLRRLTAGQVKHACVEAFVAFEIGRVLNAREYRLTPRDYHDYSDQS